MMRNKKPGWKQSATSMVRIASFDKTSRASTSSKYLLMTFLTLFRTELILQVDETDICEAIVQVHLVDYNWQKVNIGFTTNTNKKSLVSIHMYGDATLIKISNRTSLRAHTKHTFTIFLAKKVEDTLEDNATKISQRASESDMAYLVTNVLV
jgi:hypothetical protein